MTVLQHDCFVSAVGVSFEAARQVALAIASAQRASRVESVPLSMASGRVLARPIVAPRSLPAFDQAAMDGYAVNAAGLTSRSSALPVVGRTDAGDRPGTLDPGTAQRIMTGAALPAGADAVVMQECVTPLDGGIQVHGLVSADTHVRRKGEDIVEGRTVLGAGRTIRWPETALLAALGVSVVPVVPLLHVAILTTGSELRQPGQALAGGDIFDSNGPMLGALLAMPSVDVTLSTADDDIDAITSALEKFAGTSSMVVTAAGMACGDRDYVRTAIDRLGGRLDVAGVAMKPGKPLALGRLGGTCFVGLPGNPQAAAFAALAFVRPMIDCLLGISTPGRLTAALASSHATKLGRTELLPVHLNAEAGRLVASHCGQAGSHRLRPLVDADAVAVITGTGETIRAETMVEVLPFDRSGFQR